MKGQRYRMTVAKLEATTSLNPNSHQNQHFIQVAAEMFWRLVAGIQPAWVRVKQPYFIVFVHLQNVIILLFCKFFNMHYAVKSLGLVDSLYAFEKKYLLVMSCDTLKQLCCEIIVQFIIAVFYFNKCNI